MYALDQGQIPWFSPKAGAGVYWFNAVYEYVGDVDYYDIAKLRECPSKGSWIGVHYTHFNYEGPGKRIAPFFMGSTTIGACRAIKFSSVQNPSEWLMLLDTSGFYVYSPLYSTWVFDSDTDEDGHNDSSSAILGWGGSVYDHPHNLAMPKVHNNGCNVGLMDGHVEWIAYRELWEVNEHSLVVHKYWYE